MGKDKKDKAHGGATGVSGMPNGQAKITIHSARDLHESMFSKNDPYVKFGCEGKLLHKTRVSQNRKNPVWNHVEMIPYHGEQRIEFLVMDADLLTEDDAIGRGNVQVALLGPSAYTPDGAAQEVSLFRPSKFSVHDKSAGFLKVSIQILQPGQMAGQQMMGQQMMGQPMMGQPMMGQQMMGQQMPGQPMMGQPMMGQPMAGQPMMGQPMMGQPMAGQPQMLDQSQMMGQPHMMGQQAMVQGQPVMATAVPYGSAPPHPGMQQAYPPGYAGQAPYGAPQAGQVPYGAPMGQMGAPMGQMGAPMGQMGGPMGQMGAPMGQMGYGQGGMGYGGHKKQKKQKKDKKSKKYRGGGSSSGSDSS